MWLLDNPRQLTTAAQAFQHPVWSPDGTRVAFESAPVQSLTGSDIWVTPAAGGGTLNLTSSYPGVDQYPSWSPDGRQIAFVSTRDGGGVFVMPSFGGPARKLFSQPSDVAKDSADNPASGAPQWSSDGNRLAVAFPTLDERTVVAMYAFASQQLDTRHLAARCFDMSWSPDGRFFACVEGNHSWEARRLWLEPVGGGDAIPLPETEHYNEQPFWSADSRALFYTSRRGGSGDLWRQSLAADGSPTDAPERVTTTLGAVQATLSRNGDRLAVSRGRLFANVWRVPILRDRRATWADAQQLTDERAEVRHLDLSPDGQRFVVSSNRSGSWDLWSLPVGGGEWTQLTADEASERGPQFSSDGDPDCVSCVSRRPPRSPPDASSRRPTRAIAEHPGTDWFGHGHLNDSQIAFISDRAGKRPTFGRHVYRRRAVAAPLRMSPKMNGRSGRRMDSTSFLCRAGRHHRDCFKLRHRAVTPIPLSSGPASVADTGILTTT